MLMGFIGCLGAIYEIRCLLGLVSVAPYEREHRTFGHRVFTVEIKQFISEDESASNNTVFVYESCKNDCMKYHKQYMTLTRRASRTLTETEASSLFYTMFFILRKYIKLKLCFVCSTQFI